MAFTQYLVPDSVWTAAVTTFTILCLYPIVYCIYNVYFHPLSEFPGPLLWRATRLPYMRTTWSGRSPYIIRDLHEKYGDVVRIAPDELSFADSAAWEDIYSNRGNNTAFPKSKTWHGVPAGFPSSVFTAIDFKEHARFRRAMDAGFTERAVLRQEPIVQEYVDRFIDKLHERMSGDDESTVINVTEWLNYVVFDIIGDLGFGESFHCLEDVKYSPWMSFMFNSVKVQYLMISLRHYPLLFDLLMRLIPKKAKSEQEQHMNLANEKTNRRLNSEVERPDIISFMERKSGKGKEGLSVEEIQANASLLIIAGSETTVTVLTGIFNHLVQNPASLHKLTSEIRARFDKRKDMTLTALKELPYLQATLEEGLRMCNPNPIGHMRISPPQGGIVAGKFVAGNTFVTVHPYTITNSPKHFHEPHAWRPERWGEDARNDPSSPYHNDDRKASRAFGWGPQSCIGENLAWGEMRLLVASMLWAFDLKKADTPHSQVKWDAQKVFAVIEKHPLDVRLAKRVQ